MDTSEAVSKAPILIAAIGPRSRLGSLGMLAVLCMSWSIGLSWASLAEGRPACPFLVPPGSPAEDQSQRFNNALKDVESIEECEQWDGLEVIDPSNPDLIWDSSGQWVLLVTWLKDRPIGKGRTPFDRDLWATLVPGIRSMLQREVYKKVADDSPVPPQRRRLDIDVVERTRQYLGLKPDSKYNYFLEFWVSPKSLIRPCENREVTDNRRASRKRPPEFMGISQGFPFAGLGYTYDWGNRVAKVGATEFLVRAKEGIRVFQVVDNEHYLSCGAVDLFPGLNNSVRRLCGP